MSRIWRYPAAVAAIGIAAGGMMWFAGTSGADQTAAASGSVTGCVVRFTDQGPRILDDDKHRCTGAAAVSVNSEGDLVVATTARGTIISSVVDEDETLTTRGIIAGASVAVGTTRVSFYSTQDGAPIRADSPQLRGPNANIWLTWVNV